MLATGVTLDEMPYYRDGTLEKYTPSGDFVVAKFARWAFEKFPQAKDALGTQMKAVGEVMSIGKDFKEAFQKAIRSLEIGRSGPGGIRKIEALSLEELRPLVASPSSERFFHLYEAFKKGLSVEEAFKLTSIAKFFLTEIQELALFELELAKYTWMNLPANMLLKAKKFAFSDKYLAKFFNVSEKNVREKRIALGCEASYCRVPVSGVEGEEDYYYSTYSGAKDEVPVSDRKKIMVLGGGPNRIGQGIEFDYTCVHAAFALRDAGYESVLVNCNPETVSTDYDTSDKLYFEPLTTEDVLGIYKKEKPAGVIVQFGGQTPLNIAQELKDAGVTIVLEPLNILVDHAGHFLTTSKEAFEMVKEVNNPYVKVLFDIYHQQITEGNVIRNITENIDLIGHFHIADNPDRNEPGTGEINYINVFKAIKKAGYDRYLAFECGRTVDIPTLMENMKPYIAIAD